MFHLSGTVITCPIYNNEVKQFSLGDTSGMSPEEVRLFLENTSSYYLRINNGTTDVLINNYFNLSKPFIHVEIKNITLQGQNIFYSEVLAGVPVVLATPMESERFISIGPIYNNLFKVYLYDKNGAFNGGYINYVVFGERI